MSIFTKLRDLFSLDKAISQKQQNVKLLDDLIFQKKKQFEKLKQQTEELNNQRNAFSAERDVELQKTEDQCQQVIEQYNTDTEIFKQRYEEWKSKENLINKEIAENVKKNELLKERAKLYKRFIKQCSDYVVAGIAIDKKKFDDLCPTVELHLNAFDVSDLRILLRENEKLVNDLLKKYENKYTTKTNKSIYQLMVLALRAEMQNILISLKYSNLDKCKTDLKNMITKFMTIASDGNQQIAPTIKNFISELEILFEQSMDIEYTYFVRKEQQKLEQQALREQMRQEAEERKALELEQKKVEKEESKYQNEIENTKKMIEENQDTKKEQQLLARIAELNNLLEQVKNKKEDIINRQNGKAGNVYVISNLGAFGENRFKIGMTRRYEPMDRINELGNASVPFNFDVHSFIFSDDAVNLEKTLHDRLSDKRTNKINLRKEFFDVSIDELKNLVHEICPTAEFKETMLAIEYRKGLEISQCS